MSSTVLNQAVTSALKIQQDIGGSGLKGVVIGNSSNLQATVILQGAGISRTLYPYTVDSFLVPHDASQNPLPWSGNLLINFATGVPDTGAYVQVDTIGANEPFKNTYPISLSRGSVNAVVTSNSLSDESRIQGSITVDAGFPGQTGLIVIKNDGSMLWYVYQGGMQLGPHQILKANTAGNQLQLGQAADTTEVLGHLLIDGNLIVLGKAGLMTFIAPASILSGNLNSGITSTITFAGNFGVPAGATAVLINFVVTAVSSGGYASFTPHGTAWSGDNYPISTVSSANNQTITASSIIIPLDTNGKLDVTANSSNLTGIACQVYGYIM